MTTVWKYEWPMPNDEASFDMPAGAEILSVHAQRNTSLCLWARVDPGMPSARRHFTLCGTGHQAPSPLSHRFIGTALLYDDALVLHVFERGGGS